MDVNPGK